MPVLTAKNDGSPAQEIIVSYRTAGRDIAVLTCSCPLRVKL